MSDKSGIEWTDATWNPVAGCEIVSPGCAHCYAMKTAYRLEAIGQAKYQGTTKKVNGLPIWTGKVNFDEKSLTIPLRWRTPKMIFVNSMSDLFHKDVPFEFIDKVFAVMALCPQHTFQILTKRTERMAKYFSDLDRRRIEWDKDEAEHEEFLIQNLFDNNVEGSNDRDPICRRSLDWLNKFNARNLGWPLPNVWLGTSVENQKCADERIPHLLKCPAAVRFLSCEPLLGPLDLTSAPYMSSGDLHRMNCLDGYGGWDLPRWNHKVDWVIIGGESGPNARDFVVEYGGEIVRQCTEASIAVFFKQMGSRPVTTNVNLYDWPNKTKFLKWGDAAASARIKLKDSHGGDPAEWPADLRIRDFPSLRKGLEVGK